MLKTKQAAGDPWFYGQLLLLLFAVLAPKRFSAPFPEPVRIVGAFVFVLGIALWLWSAYHLSGSLSPFVRPKEGGALVRTGPYRFVRHPMYAALMLFVLGWGLFSGNVMRLALVYFLGAFLTYKSRREEYFLMDLYPEYAQYQSAVKHKFIPGVF